MIGRTLAHYRVVEEVGSGGMGVVYRALDTRLDRDVALKVIRPGALQSISARERFRKEALLLSKLNHPTIAQVFDFDTQDSVDFLVMECVKGQVLSSLIRSGPIPEETVINIGIQIADALENAAEVGIVHRDLKPSNTMITTKGKVKVLDFGLARLLRKDDPNATESIDTGWGAAGTLPYMSPEQLKGEAADFRSDVYSLGALLYEASSGQRPFDSQSSAVLISDILNKSPQPVRRRNSNLSLGFESIVSRCLAKEPRHRYQNGGEVRAALELLRDNMGKVATVEETSLTTHISIPRKALGDGVRFVGAVRELTGQAGPSAPRRIMLAVLPFENLSSGKKYDYFSDGLTEEMITQLARLSPERLGVIARTSAMQYRSTKKSVRQIGRELGVSYVLEGSVRRAGRRVRIGAQLIQVSDETHLWAESYERPLGDILALQSDVGRAIADQIPIKLAPLEQARLARTPQINPEAYEAYLRGRYLWNQRAKQALEKSLRYFEKAVEKDPDFALGYTGLADSYSVLASTAYSFSPMEAFSKGAMAARKALQLDETLAEAHASLAQSFFYALDWLAAEKELKRSIELNPSYATARHWYALYFTVRGRFSEALAEANCACALDPLSVIINRDLGIIYYYARQPDRAIEQYQKTMELDPNFALLHQGLGRAYLEKGIRADAISEIQKAVRLSRSSSAMLATLAHAYAVTGKPQEARKILRDLRARSRRSYVSPTSIAVIFVGLSDKENALEWLEKACQQRDPGLHTLKVHPIFDSLRSEPRFQDLVRRMNFPD